MNSEQQKRLGRIERQLASTTEGLVVSQDWDHRLVTVNVGGTEQTMTWVGPAPWRGDSVRVTSAAGRPFCELIMGAAQGTVVSSAGGFTTATGDDSVSYTYVHLSSTAPTSGQRVRLDHAGRCVPAGVYSVEPADSEFVPPTAPPTPGGSGTRTQTFNPTDSGDWYHSGGSWVSQTPTISVNHSGYYFYGTQIADTIPDSAAIVSASIALAELWDNVPGTGSIMGSHGYSVKPGFAPGLSGSVGVNNSGVYSILGFAAALKTGAAYGIGFYRGDGAPGTGYRAYGSYTQSGAITITWTV